MGWTYDELLALQVDVYDELVAWVLESREREDALSE